MNTIVDAFAQNLYRTPQPNTRTSIRPHQVIKVGGRCYRQLRISAGTFKDYSQQSAETGEQWNMEESVELNSDDDDIEEISGKDGKDTYRVNMDVARCFHKFIVGKGAANLKNMQRQTRTSIVVPGRNSSSSIIVITGPSIPSIRSAKTQIRMVVQSAVSKMEYTHFLSLPLLDPSWKKSLAVMKKRMLSEMPDAKGLDQSIFWKPSQFHITIAMLKLYDESTKKRALEAVEAAKIEVNQLLQRVVEKEVHGV